MKARGIVIKPKKQRAEEDGGKTGSEIQTPMAIVILCGLTTSTLLNMIVVPTLYLRYGKPVGSLEGSGPESLN